MLPISLENHKDILKIICDDKLTDEIKDLPPKKLYLKTLKSGITGISNDLYVLC